MATNKSIRILPFACAVSSSNFNIHATEIIAVLGGTAHIIYLVTYLLTYLLIYLVTYLSSDSLIQGGFFSLTSWSRFHGSGR